MPSDILTLDTVKGYLGIDTDDTRFDHDSILDMFLTAEDAFIQRLRGPHPTDVDERDARLPEILLRLVAWSFAASPYSSGSKISITVTGKEYDLERQRILEPLRWIYGK